MGGPAVLIVADEGGRPEAGTLHALTAAGVRLRVLAPSGSTLAHWLAAWGVPYEPLPLHRPRDPAAVETIRWHLDELRPRVLDMRGALAAGNCLPAVRRRPIAIVAHRGGAGRADLCSRLDRAGIFDARVGRIVCCAESVRRSFVRMRLGPFKVPQSRLVTIRPGHDVGWYRTGPIDLAALGVPKGAFVVACLAGSARAGPLRDVVRACDHLPPDLPIHFVAVGAGAGNRVAARLADRSRYRDRFQLLNDRNDTSQIVAASDVSVLVGADGGLPESLFESMACETPPIVGDAGAAAEVVEHERSGLVVPAAEPRAIAAAVLRLYNDRDVCRRLGVGARRRVAGAFTVEAAAEATVALYRELAKRA